MNEENGNRKPEAERQFDPVSLLGADDAKDAARFQWLIKQGVAWCGCYDRDWLPGEWLYAAQDARHFVDKAMAKASNTKLRDGAPETPPLK